MVSFQVFSSKGLSSLLKLIEIEKNTVLKKNYYIADPSSKRTADENISNNIYVHTYSLSLHI